MQTDKGEDSGVAPGPVSGEHHVAVDEPVQKVVAVGVERNEILVRFGRCPSTVNALHAAVVEVVQHEARRDGRLSTRGTGEGEAQRSLLVEPARAALAPLRRPQEVGPVPVVAGRLAPIAQDWVTDSSCGGWVG